MEAQERKYALRWMLAAVLAVLGLFGLVSLKLYKLHVVIPHSPEYRQRNRYTSKVDILGMRGRILDRNGVTLVESISGNEIYIDRHDSRLLKLPEERRKAIPYELAKLLGVSQDRMVDAFSEESTIGKGLVCVVTDDERIAELKRRCSTSVPESERIMGVNYTNTRSVRTYANGARLCHTLGYVQGGTNGVYGIEQRFDKYLRGKDGKIIRTMDAKRRELRDRRLEDLPPVHGDDVYLTIDNNIQYIIENALSKALENFRAASGIIIVQHIKTGEILGLATLPEFDPTDWGNMGLENCLNIAASRNYEPGSVMKAVTVATALQYGVITENTPFDVGQKGYWVYAGKPLRDHAFGVIRAREILAQSSNIGTAMIGLKMAEPNPRLGVKRNNELLWRAFKSMGFGEKTGIELMGEEGGIVRHFSRWDKLSPTRMPIGQGISVTALQLCNAYATIGNGGHRMKPTLLKKIVTHDGEIVQENKPIELGRPISEAVSAKMLDLMQSVTRRSEHGTAARAALKSYEVAGKTGTGQIPINGSYNHSDYNASFVGIYPATNPELAILVTIERPSGVYKMGGSVAAPVFAEVAEPIGHYLGLPADKVTAEKK